MREFQKARCRAHQPIGGLERDARLEANGCRFASGCRSLPTRLFPHPLARSALDGLRFDRGKKTGQGMSPYFSNSSSAGPLDAVVISVCVVGSKRRIAAL